MGQQVRRSVEGRDGQRHAGGRPVGERGVPDAAGPARDRQQLAADLACLGRADRQGVGDPVDLAAAVLDRLAQLQREQRGQPVAPFRGGGRRSVQDVGPGGRSQPGHGRGRVGREAGGPPTSSGPACAARLTTRRRYGPVRSAQGPSPRHSPATSAGTETTSSVITRWST